MTERPTTSPRTWFITGASRGLGRAFTDAALDRGDRVAAVSRTTRTDDDRTSLLQIAADVRDPASVRSAVEQAVETFGRLDIVVNNAGVMLLGPLVDAPVEEWDRMIDLNVKGLLYTAHAALPHLLRAAQDGPRQVADLVNISSVAGRRVGQGGGLYQATKHAVGVFSEALRQEVTTRFVRSSLVEPGATESELVMHVREEVRANLTPSAHQILRAADIADAIVYIVTRPRHVAVNEILIRPTEQER